MIAVRRRPFHALLAPALSAASAFVLVGLLASPALAHSELVSSDPADGSVLDHAPSQVVLTFNEDVQKTGTAIIVSDADDVRIDQVSGLAVDGTDVTVPVDTTVGTGEYTIAYRVVSADGHVVEGSLQYSVVLPGEATPTPTTTATDSATSDSSDGPPPWAFLFAIVGVAAGLMAVVVAIARRARG